MTDIIAMVPARLGSQRLKQKNLLELGGEPIIARAVRKALTVGLFREVWVNSEAEVLGEIAVAAGAHFHKRPEELGSNTTTSEDFVAEFLRKHPCDYLVQIHSIAPLLTEREISGFVETLVAGNHDTLLAGVEEYLQCMVEEEPVNFLFTGMQATQDLKPVQRVTWSVTGWRASTYLQAYNGGHCATFHGKVGFFPIGRPSGLVIKYEEDFRMIEALFSSGFGS